MIGTKQREISIKITSEEIKNICQQYRADALVDDDRSYAIKKAMSKLSKSDFIIYCLFLEMGTKTEVADVLGISRISASRIIRNIEDEIRELVKSDNILYNK